MKEKIDKISFLSMIILSIISSSIGISLYTLIKIASIDSYISTIISTIIGLIPLFIFIYLFNNYENLNINKKINLLFNKIISKIINTILLILVFIISSTIIFNLGNFIVTQYLFDTPLLLILITIGITISYTVNKGIETISRVSFIFLIIVLILFSISFIILSKQIEINNIKPFLEYGIKKPFIGGIINSCLVTSPLYALLIIPKDNLNSKKNFNNKIISSYLLSSLIIFLITLLSVSILGKYLLNIYQYPGYISIKKISIYSFIDRIENFMSFHWLLSCFITITINIYYILVNINKKNSKLLNYLITLFIVMLSFYLFKNNTYFTSYIYHIYPYICLLLFLIHLLISFKIFMHKIKNNDYNISKQ